MTLAMPDAKASIDELKLLHMGCMIYHYSINVCEWEKKGFWHGVLEREKRI